MRTFSGRALCAHRTRLGWRHEHVAVKINRSSSAVRNYEHGRAVPPVDVAVKMAEAFGVPLEELLEEQAEVAS